MYLPQAVKKYLSKQNFYNWKLECNTDKLFNNIIVIPAIQEFENIKKLLISIKKNEPRYLQNTLLVFVINNLKYEGSHIKNDNLKSIRFLKNYTSTGTLPHIGIIDAATENKELPEKNGGVGYARKIGMDLALKKFNYSNKEKKILISLDADCTVSENYLKTVITEFNTKNISAAIVNFEHKLPDNPKQKIAIINYEIFLRYYMLGLTYAKSPYAFYTIGSTIVCDYESYIKIGGMNKRKAGEDFYFLQKLAKTVNIKRIKNATVYPSSRISSRVPFGTGQKIKSLIIKNPNNYYIYSAKSFYVLKNWLDVFQKENLTSEKYLTEAKLINKGLYNFLIQNKFETTWNKILENGKTNKQLIKQKKLWMDGFKTLKLIHHLRDYEFPNQNIFNALNDLLSKLKPQNFPLHNTDNSNKITVNLEYLKLLKNIT